MVEGLCGGGKTKVEMSDYPQRASMVTSGSFYGEDVQTTCVCVLA